MTQLPAQNLTPQLLLDELPSSPALDAHVFRARQTIRNIMQGKDPRLLVIMGPCSIHDPKAALEYAHLLKSANNRFEDELFLVMRTYFEKPRTALGWKGLISDPELNGNFDIHQGLRLARKLLLDINTLGIPTATEFLETTLPQFLQDLISWCAIGARTSSSQLHRELASGLPMPVGFKNSIDGNISIAIDAVKVASYSHHYFSIDKEGSTCILRTPGNKDCHIILRGSTHATNYQQEFVAEASQLLTDFGLTPKLMIDCSHGNSMKNHLLQQDVIHAIIQQWQNYSKAVTGIMLESNLVSGKQNVTPQQPLIYGKSITDACLSWEETIPLLEKLAKTISRGVK